MNYTGATILPHPPASPDPGAGSPPAPGSPSSPALGAHGAGTRTPELSPLAHPGPPWPNMMAEGRGLGSPSPIPSTSAPSARSPLAGSPLLQGAPPDFRSSADRRTEEILLPHQGAQDVTYLSVDIGGSLAKVVWFVPHGGSEEVVEGSPDPSATATVGGRLLFHRFETAKIQACYDFVRALLPPSPSSSADAPAASSSSPSPTMSPPTWILKLTGGGAYKFFDLFSTLPVRIEREDEMACLISGLNFFTRQVECEVFAYDERNPGDPVTFEGVGERLFPYLVVNIGSG